MMRALDADAASPPIPAYPNPFTLFSEWFEAARRYPERIIEPEAMALATATADGRPSVRMVLLKAVDERGFVFYTNYTSRKATELNENPRAALLFWWEPLERQVRVEGTVRLTDPEESDAYFRTRPRASQLGAWSSPQSQTIRDRDELDQRFREAQERFRGQEVPRPSFWGGYRLEPHTFEFWKGEPARRHQRLLYRRAEGSGGHWTVTRLAP